MITYERTKQCPYLELLYTKRRIQSLRHVYDFGNIGTDLRLYFILLGTYSYGILGQKRGSLD